MGEYEYSALDPVFQCLLEAPQSVEAPLRVIDEVSGWHPGAVVKHRVAIMAPIHYGYIASLDRATAMPVAYMAGYYGSPIIMTHPDDAQFAAFAFRSIQVFA